MLEKNNIRDVAHRKLISFLFLYRVYIHVWILSSYWFSWGLHTIIKKKKETNPERKQCHIYDIYLNFDLLWMRWQAHSMDNHRLEIEYRNETWWPAAMSNSFTLIEKNKNKKRKKKERKTAAAKARHVFIHSFRWNHHHEKKNERIQRNPLASLFLFLSLPSGERETENYRKRKIKIHSMTISFE